MEAMEPKIGGNNLGSIHLILIMFVLYVDDMLFIDALDALKQRLHSKFDMNFIGDANHLAYKYS